MGQCNCRKKRKVRRGHRDTGTPGGATAAPGPPAGRGGGTPQGPGLGALGTA